MFTSLHSRKGKRITFFFGLVFMLSLILSACGGDNGTATNKPVSLNIVDSPKGSFTSNFNPLLDQGGTRTGTQGLLYEPLIFVNRLDGKITPWLASSYKFADDAQSASFTLRDGVKWSDGQALTAEDVVYSFTILKDFPALDRQSLWTNLLTDVKAASDGKTINFTFKQPNSIAFWYFSQSPIVPKHVWSTVSDPVKYTNDAPIVTGPYTLKSFTADLYVLQKNASYWQSGKPEVDELRFPAAKDNDAVIQQLQAGDLDWTGVAWDPKLDATVKSDVNHWFAGDNLTLLYLNLTKAPFNDLKVRQAMSLVINRDEIQQKAAPYAAPANPSGVLPVHKDYLSPDYANAKFTVDAAKAASLMQEAGYAKGSDGIYAKDGKKISFKLIVVHDWNDWVASTQIIVDQLKAFGMDASIDSVSGYDPYFKALQTGDFDAGISWTDKGPTPYFAANDLLSGNNSAAIGENAKSTNWQRWQDADTDTLLNKYFTSADAAAQKQALYGLQKIIAEKLPSIPLNYNVSWYEYSTKKVTGWPSQDNPYAYGSPYNGFDNAYVVLQLKKK